MRQQNLWPERRQRSQKISTTFKTREKEQIWMWKQDTQLLICFILRHPLHLAILQCCGRQNWINKTYRHLLHYVPPPLLLLSRRWNLGPPFAAGHETTTGNRSLTAPGATSPHSLSLLPHRSTTTLPSVLPRCVPGVKRTDMANAGIQLMGFCLAFLGFIGSIASTVMVEWKASSYAGDNIITAQAMYEGLWKTCASQSTGQVQCKVYDSLLQLPGIVQGTRGLMLASVLFSFIAMMVAVVGMRCTTCLADSPQQKDKMALAGGVVFIIAGVMALVGTSWFGHRVAQDFYNPLTPTNTRYEFGSALYVGWGAASLSILGGSCLCCNCGSQGSSGKGPRYPPSSSGQTGRDYV